MKRTTIYLSEQAVEKLERLARQRRVPQSVIIREAIEHYDSDSKVLVSVGAGASGRKDLSRRFDEFLFGRSHSDRPKVKRGARF